MSLFLPIPDRPAFREQITLDDVPYNLLLTWNERAAGWVLGLEDRDGAPLLSGRRLVFGIDLLGGFHHLDVPTGGLFVVVPAGQITQISREDLTSGRVLLLYTPRSELDVL